MMELQYRSRDGRLLLKIEGATHKDVFRALAAAQEIFAGDSKCGMCSSDDLHFRVRMVENFEFFELACQACGAALGFGQRKDGEHLFPKRRDEDGNSLPNGGWSKWTPSA